MDCIEGMKLLENNSIDSIVTDPPYNLTTSKDKGFMGKKWDGTGITFDVDLWEECLRVLKPGGYLLSFGGTRTFHRMTCAIENAGFTIHPIIAWVYGSGFPKGANLSKNLDKQAGVERKVVGVGKGAAKNPKGFKHDNNVQSGGEFKKQFDVTAPATPEAIKWDGWYYGLQSLKPAVEPICLAQKPIDGKRMTDNVLKWGTGAVNIDGCRIDVDPKVDDMLRETTRGKRQSKTWEDGSGFKNEKNQLTGVRPEGRFPANVIFDEFAGGVLDQQSGKLTSGTNCIRTKAGSFLEHGGLGKAGDTQVTYGDTGGASRFFKNIEYEEGDMVNFYYCAKASKKERGEGNLHPCVKPLKLIKYLVKLITSPSGISLDPFMGSGTHALACKELGFDFIGFEMSKEYCDIAERRLDLLKESGIQHKLKI